MSGAFQYKFNEFHTRKLIFKSSLQNVAHLYQPHCVNHARILSFLLMQIHENLIYQPCQAKLDQWLSMVLGMGAGLDIQEIWMARYEENRRQHSPLVCIDSWLPVYSTYPLYQRTKIVALFCNDSVDPCGINHNMRSFLFFVIIRLMLLMNTSDRFMHTLHCCLKYIDFLFLGNKSAKQGLLSNSTFNWLFIYNSQIYNLSSGDKMCKPEMHS